jgi:hypothetical protein
MNSICLVCLAQNEIDPKNNLPVSLSGLDAVANAQVYQDYEVIK